METILKKSLEEIMGMCFTYVKKIAKNPIGILLLIFITMPLLIKFYEVLITINSFMNMLIVFNFISLFIATALDIKVFEREIDWKLLIASVIIILSCFIVLKTNIFSPKGSLYEDYTRLYQEILNKDYDLKYYLTLTLDPKNTAIFYHYSTTVISIYGMIANLALLALNFFVYLDIIANNDDNDYRINKLRKTVCVNAGRIIIWVLIFYILALTPLMKTICYRLLPEYFAK